MIEVTMTELRRDLFRLVDLMAETGESLRVRRRGQAIDLSARTQEKSVSDMTPQERWDRWLEKAKVEGPNDCPDDLDSYKGHWTWNPDTKFRDL